MKRIVYSFLLATTGGLIALGGYKLMEPKKVLSFETQQKVNYVRVAGHTPGLSSAGLLDFTVPAALSTPAVVHITNNMKVKKSSDNMMDPFEFFNHGGMPMSRGPQKAFGSGVIISSDGYIVTNNHVIEDANNIQVILENKQQYKAKLIGTDPTTDIALLKIQAEGLPILKFGNSDDVKVGEWVLAVGNPFNLTSTVTAGIVSAKGRNIGILGSPGEGDPQEDGNKPKVNTSVESYIQTDAAVNRGNSGGALVNVNGELIGINSAIASGTGNYEGYSFAVPVNLVKKVVDDLRNFGTVQRGFLGVSISDVSAELVDAKKLNDKEIKGVYVGAVTSDGAAKASGIVDGDIILKIQGTAVNSASELTEQVARFRPGNSIAVVVLRNGAEKTFNATLKNSQGNMDIQKSPVLASSNAAGIQTIPLTAGELKKFNKPFGVKIIKEGEGIFKKMGIKPGFVILNINDQDIKSSEDIEGALENSSDSISFSGFYIDQPNSIMSFQQSIAK
jgi:serine protease Do